MYESRMVYCVGGNDTVGSPTGTEHRTRFTCWSCVNNARSQERDETTAWPIRTAHNSHPLKSINDVNELNNLIFQPQTINRNRCCWFMRTQASVTSVISPARFFSFFFLFIPLYSFPRFSCLRPNNFFSLTFHFKFGLVMRHA